MIVKSTKTYGHERGLTCVFRQPGAESHCRHLHGYALSFSFTFASDKLDQNNWVVDFGAMKPIKAWLDDTFDHTLVIAADDPHRAIFEALEEDFSVAKVVVLAAVGCEAFAATAGEYAGRWAHEKYGGRVWLESCTVAEHSSNSATVQYRREDWESWDE